jgi:hypothetical protein
VNNRFAAGLWWGATAHVSPNSKHLKYAMHVELPRNGRWADSAIDEWLCLKQLLDREVGGFAECGKAIDALRGEAPMLRFSGLF